MTVAESEGVATAATASLSAAMAFLAENPIVLVIAGFTALIGIAGKALSAFSESEDQIARIALQMRNLGNVFPIGELTEFAGRLSQLTGIDDEQIAALGAMAVQFGLTRQQTEAFIPTVLDVATATHKSFQEVETAILRATRGQTRGLLALGIDPSKIKGDLHDVDNLIRQVGAGFEGTAAAFRGTLPGTVSALQTSVGNLFEAIGRFISPVVVPLLNTLIFVLDKVTALLTFIADKFSWAFPTAAALGQGGKANELALKGDPEQTAALQGIEKNTAVLDPLVKQVLGGKGTVARRAFTWRDQRLAFGI